jgi:alkylhydroperoxidase family enzyme
VTSRASRSQLDELQAVADSAAPAPEAMAPYLDKVRDCAYELTDADVQALKSAGFSEDEIFEQTVAVAIREGFRRLSAAESVIG